MFPVTAGRVGKDDEHFYNIITFYLTLPPYVRDSLEDKSVLVHFKKDFSLTSLGQSSEKKLTDLF